MFVDPHIAADTSPDEWAVRSEYWLAESRKSQRKRLTRERNSNALILTGQGTSLRIESGALVIWQGFSHYPQQQEVHRYFRGDLALPRIIILLDGSGSLSFDVLSWLAEQGVALARIKASGEIATVASGTGYASDREKIEWQKATRADERKRLAFAADLIRRKIASSLPTLEAHILPSKSRDMAFAKAQSGIERLSQEKFTDINEVFAIEGECASAYFRAWHGLPMRWKGIQRHPVPVEWHAYNWRSSRATGVKPENRNASHPINAMLNYAYAVKLTKVQIEAIANGYDPTLGIMHNSKRGSPAWVLDMIELERAEVDAAILQLVREKTFAAADFIIRKDGVCRLSPQLARMVATIISLPAS